MHWTLKDLLRHPGLTAARSAADNGDRMREDGHDRHDVQPGSVRERPAGSDWWNRRRERDRRPCAPAGSAARTRKELARAATLYLRHQAGIRRPSPPRAV